MTRNCVERVFGILKRFGVLATTIRTKLASRSDIVGATVVLNNIAVKKQPTSGRGLRCQSGG